MADDKKVESPELINLREREKVLVAKGKRLDEMDANHQARAGIDLNQVKSNNAVHLSNIRKEIERLSK